MVEPIFRDLLKEENHIKLFLMRYTRLILKKKKIIR